MERDAIIVQDLKFLGTFDFDPGCPGYHVENIFYAKGSPSNLKKHTAIRTKQNVSVQIDGQFKKFLEALKIAGKAVTSKQNKEGRKDKQEDGKTMDSNVRKS